MEVLEGNCGENESGPLFDFVDVSLNFSDVFFGYRGIHSEIYLKFVYDIFKIHVHEYSMYYNSTSGIYFHN